MRTAQVCRSPAAIEIASSSPATAPARARGVRVPSPSWPSSLRPQHATVPSSRRRHAWVLPAASAATGLSSQARATHAPESLPACST